MKKRLLFTCFFLIFECIFTVCAHAETADFDDSSAIVVMRADAPQTRMFSTSSPFDGLGISDVKAVCELPDDKPQLFSAFSPKRTVLEVTFDEKSVQNVLNKIDLLNALPEVEYAEPNYIYTLFDVPNDPDYDKQYALEKISAPAAWDLDIDCSGVTVAVMDSGVMLTHPDLRNNIWTNPDEVAGDGEDNDGNSFNDDIHGWNFIDSDAGYNVDDEIGHGTHVAGIISAETNNGVGVASIARNAKIASVRIFNADGNTVSSSILKAFKYVAEMNIPIVNCSFGGSASETLFEFIKSHSDLLVVAAAGNDNNNNDRNGVYPASYECDNVISVASSDKEDKLSYYGNKNGKDLASNYGAKTVDIAAPGSAVWSTYAGSELYKTQNGTSMACPMVTGAAALVKAKYPDMTPAEIIEKIKSSADVLPSLTGKVETGGRLNVYEAAAKHAQGVTFAETSLTLTVGKSAALNVRPVPADTTDKAVWSSNNENAVEVKDGIVTAKNEGTATITLTYSDGVTASCTVTVEKYQPTLEDNSVEISRDENNVKVLLNLNGARSDDVLLFAAIRMNGELKTVLMPSVKSDMSAEFTIPDGMDGAETTVYVWGKNNQPYTKPAKVENE